MKMSSLFVLLWAFCPIRLLEMIFVPQAFCLIRVIMKMKMNIFFLVLLWLLLSKLVGTR